jgi:hypothetical protein
MRQKGPASFSNANAASQTVEEFRAQILLKFEDLL